MARICLIGGAGFIGSYLTQQLQHEHTIFIIDKAPGAKTTPSFTYIRSDIRDLASLEASFPENIDTVVLLAAEHKDDVEPISLYYDVNVKGMQNVLDVMDKKQVSRLVFTSSVAVYGLNKEQPNESSPVDPFNHYGKSKWQAEEVARKWITVNSARKSLTIIRPTVTFGPGNRGNVYNLLAQISSGRFLMIGSGNNKKSMAYVENVASFIRHCVNQMGTGLHVFNYVDKPDFSTRDLVREAERAIGKRILPLRIPYFLGYSGALMLDVVSRVTGKKFPVTAVRVQKFCATTQFESLTIGATGYHPPVPLHQGLQITMQDILSSASG